MSANKIFSKLELLNLVKDGKKIILVDNKLYDVTLYYKIHPGSSKAIKKKCLKIDNNRLVITDCSIDYNFHSKNSHQIWKDLQIGITHKKNNIFNLWGLLDYTNKNKVFIQSNQNL